MIQENEGLYSNPRDLQEVILVSLYGTPAKIEIDKQDTINYKDAIENYRVDDIALRGGGAGDLHIRTTVTGIVMTRY